MNPLDHLPAQSEMEQSAAWLRTAWEALAPVPNREAIYARFLAYAIPYTGSIGAVVHELRAGYARTSLVDRPELRNHLRSVHAIALANLAELTGNAALAAGLPANARFIVTELNMRYLKKAHGPIDGTCEAPVPTDNARREYEIAVALRDRDGDVVAEATMKTLVGPTKSRA